MKTIKTALFQCIVVYVCLPVISFSQTNQPQNLAFTLELDRDSISQQTESDSIISRPKNGLKFNGTFAFGTGGDKLSVGETSDGEEITVCTGGGFGMAITLGYNFFSRVDLDLSAGYQVNWNRPECDNGNFNFSRVPLLATAKVWIPTGKQAFIKLGGGIGYYTNVKYEMDVDLSVISHVEETVEYENTSGFHVVGEYEIIGPEKPLSFIIGLKYYHVNYTANGAYSQGTNYSVGDISYDFRELRGSGFDLYFGFGYYF
jgi:hypothetical protein